LFASLLQQSFALMTWREKSSFVSKPLSFVSEALLTGVHFLETATLLHTLLLPG
jgi:hypothetical protein